MQRRCSARAAWRRPRGLRTAPDAASGDTRRLALSVASLPRTHFNVNVSYYRDYNTSSEVLVTTWLVQSHLYL